MRIEVHEAQVNTAGDKLCRSTVSRRPRWYGDRADEAASLAARGLVRTYEDGPGKPHLSALTDDIQCSTASVEELALIVKGQARRRRYEKRIAEIDDLPQLFIAV